MLVFSEQKIDPSLLPEGVRLVRLDAADMPDIEVVVCCRATARRLAGRNMPKLKLIQLTSAGFDGIPLETYAQKGVRVANAAGVYSVPIAETVVLGMLQIAKKFRENPNNRRVKYTRGYSLISELAGKTVMILGAGNIGTEVARRLAGFQMTIVGYDVSSAAKEGYGRIVSDRDALKCVLKDSDYVVCTLPGTGETREMVNAELIADMKPGCVFVNVGRRTTVNESDLYHALKTRRLGGAVLDMFEWFPNPVTNRFRRLSNVIVLPGVAAISKECTLRLHQFVARNLVKVMRGEQPEHVVSLQGRR
jgi:phosphoglycerate dehydrogenase-like enzyme